MACDYSMTQMKPTNPYPTVTSEIDRAFYMQFASVEQVRSFYGDIPTGNGCKIDAFVVNNLAQVVRGDDSRYLCIANISPEGIFNCGFTMKGIYFVLFPLTTE